LLVEDASHIYFARESDGNVGYIARTPRRGDTPTVLVPNTFVRQLLQDDTHLYYQDSLAYLWAADKKTGEDMPLKAQPLSTIFVGSNNIYWLRSVRSGQAMVQRVSKRGGPIIGGPTIPITLRVGGGELRSDAAYFYWVTAADRSNRLMAIPRDGESEPIVVFEEEAALSPISLLVRDGTIYFTSKQSGIMRAKMPEPKPEPLVEVGENERIGSLSYIAGDYLYYCVETLKKYKPGELKRFPRPAVGQRLMRVRR
jgi:hypothetical protein